MSTPSKSDNAKFVKEQAKGIQHNVDEATHKQEEKAQKSVDAYDAPDVRAYNASVAAKATPPPAPIQTEPKHESYITKPKDASAQVEKPIAEKSAEYNPHTINRPVKK